MTGLHTLATTFVLAAHAEGHMARDIREAVERVIRDQQLPQKDRALIVQRLSNAISLVSVEDELERGMAVVWDDKDMDLTLDALKLRFPKKHHKAIDKMFDDAGTASNERYELDNGKHGDEAIYEKYFARAMKQLKKLPWEKK